MGDSPDFVLVVLVALSGVISLDWGNRSNNLALKVSSHPHHPWTIVDSGAFQP